MSTVLPSWIPVRARVIWRSRSPIAPRNRSMLLAAISATRCSRSRRTNGSTASRRIESVFWKPIHSPYRFRTTHFQCVTVAFGLRNVADTDQGLREMSRVCRPGGQVMSSNFQAAGLGTSPSRMAFTFAASCRGSASGLRETTNRRTNICPNRWDNFLTDRHSPIG